MPQPLPRPTPGPFRPTDTPLPLRGKAEAREAAQGLRAARTTPTRGPKTARTALRPPCNVRSGVRPGARCSVRPVPFFRLRRLSELGSPVPAPAPSSLRLPFAIPAARRLRPFAPASRHRFPPDLSRLSYFPPLRDSPLPVACRLLPLPAPLTSLRPPLPTSGLSRSPPVLHQPITGKRRPNNEQVNSHFVCVSDAHARNRKGSVSAPPPRLTLLSVEPQRVTRASPSRPPSPTPSRPVVSRQTPP